MSVITLPVRLSAAVVGLGWKAARGVLSDLGGRQAQPVPVRRPASHEPPPAPPHVSEQAVTVATSAEPGIASVGAEVSIAEPCDGYDRMTVSEIARQLSAAPIEAAMAVRLYELADRNRSGVLGAAERRLRTVDR